MTDNDIIKALKICIGMHNDCNGCPLLEYSQANDECMTELMSNAFDLINRQQKDIDDLCKVLGRAYQENYFLKVSRKCVRAEAIKEFAEKLKEECSFETDVSLGYGRPCYEDAVPIIAIDNLVKEMVGESYV